MKFAPVINALAIPPGALVDQRVPKKLLLEQGAPTAVDKRQIQDGIEDMVWAAALKPTNIGVPIFRNEEREYLEIALLTVTLRSAAKPNRLIELIHRAIPYANTPFEFFLYDSSKLGQLRNFATSPNIQIMVVTVGAINKKDVNNIYGKGANEQTGGERPIDLITATRPILIVDEPQSVDGGLEGRGKEALGAMNPLCTLRYSATHADKHHMLYRLDAVDAYERKLVKQIEVASLEVEGGHNKGYVKLLSTSNKRGAFSAKVELDVQRLLDVSRETVIVKPGDDLQQITGRAVYADFLVQNIGCKVGGESLELSNLEKPLRPGEAVGDVDGDALKRLMIRRTIEEHLDKELRLRPQGIKVLSLFFIDVVEHYRSYTADGAQVKGKYAVMFEEEYRKAAARPKYRTLFNDVDLESDATEVHDGYFSIDKKGTWTDTAENNQGNRENAERAYNLIMKDKEKLLSFDTKLKFIFSHSALREGWDNPNVFQICAIREMGTERERRQTIGRGLRLCVNQQGDRLRGFDINTLTVIATEGYEQFAANLQKEIEEDTGIRFGIVEKHQFAAIPVTDGAGRTTPLGVPQSEVIWTHLKDAGYVDAKGKVQDVLRKVLKDGTLQLPEPFTAHLPQVKEILRKLAGKLDIKNADDRKTIRTRQAVLHSEEFQALWNRIKHKTTYRVEFDNEQLVTDCARAIRECPPITKTRVQIRKADLAIGRGGVLSAETAVAAPITIEETDIELPDLLTDLQDKTQLTRRSLVRILTGSDRLDDFKRNPQQFIELSAESINRTSRPRLGVRGSASLQPLYLQNPVLYYSDSSGRKRDMSAQSIVFGTESAGNLRPAAQLSDLSAQPPSTVHELLESMGSLTGDQSQLSMLRTTAAKLSEFSELALDKLPIEFLIEVTQTFAFYLKTRRYSPNTIRTYCRYARQLLHFAEELGWSSEKGPVALAWESIIAALKKIPRSTRGIVRFAIRIGKTPADLTDKDLEEWRAWMQRRGRTYTTARNVAQKFRRAVSRAELRDLLPKLSWEIHPSVNVYRVKTNDMPEPIRSEVVALLKWKQDRFAKGRPSRGRLRAVSARLLESLINRVYGYAVNVDKRTEICSLVQLVSEDVITSFVAWALNERNLSYNSITKLSMLYAAMRHHPQYKENDYRWFSALFQQLPVDEESLVVKRKAAKYVPYDVLAEVPDQIRASWKQQSGMKDQSVSWLVHDELLLAWLVTLPWRQRNLRECRIGDPSTSNLFLAELPLMVHIAKAEWVERACADDPHQKFWQFHFREDETKTGNAVRGIVPRRLLPLLEEYLTDHRPGLVGAGPDSGTLFLNRSGTPLQSKETTELVAQRFFSFTGRRVTPHICRDIFAYKFLADFPEDYLTLSKILWHRDIHTTLRVYGKNFDESDGVRRVDDWLGPKIEEGS